VAQKVAGYSLAEADNLRKACGKKDRALIAKEREKFVAGCDTHGYGAKLGTDLFDIIEPFADYAFNKSHAYGYGFIAYQTAWLKANHRVEYLAALLTSVKDNQDKSAVYLNECRARGIKVEVPDVNRSISDFSVADEDGAQVILFGLSAVRNVGEGLVGLIIEERDRNGPFADFHDFCNRVDPQVLNKRTIESLTKAGGFDSLGHERLGLLKVHEVIIDRTLARRRKEAEGQFDLFGSVDDSAGAPVEPAIAIPDDAFDKMTRLTYEKEMLGLYVSDHPLMGVEHQVRRKADSTIAEFRDGGSTDMRTIGGVVTGLQRKYTKKGELMAIFVLEDLEAAIEVMVFPKTMLEHGTKLADDRIVCIRGRLDSRDDMPKVIAMDIIPVELLQEGEHTPLRLSFPAHGLDGTRVDILKKLLVSHPGPSPVLVQIGAQTVRLSDEFRVDESNGLRAELLAEFGSSALLP
jgi:DNA polymerase-3 subunit alpha